MQRDVPQTAERPCTGQWLLEPPEVWSGQAKDRLGPALDTWISRTGLWPGMTEPVYIG
jgi:hypothetical protein